MTSENATWARRRRLAAPPALALACALTVTGASPFIAAAAEDRPTSPFSATDWSSTSPTDLALVRSTIGGNQTTTTGLTGAGVGVALIDTGVVNVPGLPAANVVNGPDLSFESQAPDLRYLDTYGHGTHLAGIIVGNDPTTGTKGVAPGAKLTSIKVGTANGAVDVSQVIAGIDWTVQHRNDDPANPIRVINLAYGTTGEQKPDIDPLHAAVEHAWKAGIVVVVAAGNAGTFKKIANPAYSYRILSVGASETYGTASPTDDAMSDFSVTNTSYKLPDVYAPGRSILSLRNPGSDADNKNPTARVGETLFRGSGTSQASAVVSGGIALLLQARPTLTPDQVRSLVMSTASKSTAKSKTIGFGSLNVAGALAAPAPTITSSGTWSNGSGPMETGRGVTHVNRDTKTLSGQASIFGPFSATAWNSASSAGTAWNGGLWMGYRLAGDGWTGTSWASKTWAPATWPGNSWAGTTWTDDNWNGRFWNGRFWNAGTWSARYWSSDSWTTDEWA